ncbi:MAG TPA: tetratricopeptide repeat protein, partial [Candidatus Kapabacteria bacterium]|nr:tetratricopeptide repeat protein [Candidatus Kapabacteria bacterium]
AKSRLGDTKGAIFDFTKAIEFNPQFAEAYYNRAIVYGQEGKETLACADLQKASELGHKEAEVMIEENCKK